MRLVWQKDDSRVYCGDAIEVLSCMDDDSVDMVLTDPPYGVTRNEWDKVIDPCSMWRELLRVGKKNAVYVFTASQPYTSQLVMSNLKMFRYEWIWRKNRSSGFLNAKKMPLKQHESILVFYQGSPTYNPQKSVGHKPVNSFTKRTGDGSNYGDTCKGLSGGGQTDRYPTTILSFPVVSNARGRKHPNQKPEDMMRYLVSTYTNEGDRVLDFCAGSGTTGAACLGLNRKFVGIELLAEYADIAAERLSTCNEARYQ